MTFPPKIGNFADDMRYKPPPRTGPLGEAPASAGGQSFGDLLRLCINEHYRFQNRFSMAVGIDPSSVNRILGEDTPPTAYMLGRILKGFDAETQSLLKAKWDEVSLHPQVTEELSGDLSEAMDAYRALWRRDQLAQALYLADSLQDDARNDPDLFRAIAEDRFALCTLGGSYHRALDIAEDLLSYGTRLNSPLHRARAHWLQSNAILNLSPGNGRMAIEVQKAAWAILEHERESTTDREELQRLKSDLMRDFGHKLHRIYCLGQAQASTLDQAFEGVKRAVLQSVDDHQRSLSHLMIARIEGDRGNHFQAEEAIEQAQILMPRAVGGFGRKLKIGRAHVLWRRGKQTEALNLLEDVIASCRKVLDVHHDRSAVWLLGRMKLTKV